MYRKVISSRITTRSLASAASAEGTGLAAIREAFDAGIQGIKAETRKAVLYKTPLLPVVLEPSRLVHETLVSIVAIRGAGAPGALDSGRQRKKVDEFPTLDPCYPKYPYAR